MGCTSATSIGDVPDDLLELVLLRVRSAALLLRAAAACRRWRHVVAGAGFLPRFRSLHGPQAFVVGHFCATTPPGGLEILDFVPSPPRPATHLRRRVSLDFLHRPDHPYRRPALTDSRGGLLALVHGNRHIVVCDPWTRQRRELEFDWSREDEIFERQFFFSFLGAYLLDADDEAINGGPRMPDFRVLCVRTAWEELTERAIVHARVFSARDNRWLWSVVTDTPNGALGYESFMGRAGGSLFWLTYDGGVVLLDESSGKFSAFMLPAAADTGNDPHLLHRAYIRAVHGSNGAVRILHILGDDLEVLAWAHGGVEWVLERKVNLSQLANIVEVGPGWSWHFQDTVASTAAAALGLMAASSSSTIMFHLDLETMKLMQSGEKWSLYSTRVFSYELPWPPTINACL
ncbi:hypothetical protein ACP70R_020870 [Stipagrostis hirtigluma subsp. patula]